MIFETLNINVKTSGADKEYNVKLMGRVNPQAERWLSMAVDFIKNL